MEAVSATMSVRVDDATRPSRHSVSARVFVSVVAVWVVVVIVGTRCACFHRSRIGNSCWTCVCLALTRVPTGFPLGRNIFVQEVDQMRF